MKQCLELNFSVSGRTGDITVGSKPEVSVGCLHAFETTCRFIRNGGVRKGGFGIGRSLDFYDASILRCILKQERVTCWRKAQWAGIGEGSTERKKRFVM